VSVTTRSVPELARIVDGGLHPHDGGLVVDLHPVAGHAMTDAPSLRSTFGVGHDLSFQGWVQLASQKAQHIFRRHVQGRVTDKIGPDRKEMGSGLEHDVGRDLSLV
jgi:hypothetical protein